MNTDFLSLLTDDSVHVGIQTVRAHSTADDRLVESYVVDVSGVLVGRMTKHQLLLAEPDTTSPICWRLR